MCGITGIWHLNGSCVEKEKIERFNDSLTHRGPDGAGISFHSDNSLAFGHRRLSILDISDAGKQPMTFADGQLMITYNGEIFNFIELREQLKKFGYKFSSDSDTEVILASYHRWGKECFDKFNGMWALAIWDEKLGELVLSRDRFGIKPLYYLNEQFSFFGFASETKAFKSLDGFDRKIDDQLLETSMINPVLLEGTSKTIFYNIRALPPGHLLILSKGRKLKIEKWWSIDSHIYGKPKTFDESVFEFESTLSDAVKIRMISDVPMSTALSGGLDSTTIFGYVNRFSELDMRTPSDRLSAFTVSFPEMESDELKYASEAARFFENEVEVVKHNQDGLLENLISAQRSLDAYSPAPILAISEVYRAMKRSGRSVSMDGHGVDEMMYGYRGMIDELYYRSISDMDHKLALELAEVKVGLVHPKRRKKLRIKLNTELNSIPSGIRAKFISFLKPSESSVLEHPLIEQYRFNPAHCKNHSDIALMEFTQLTLPTVLRNFDRASMMNSVEVRMPFMDYRLVSLILSMPVTYNVNQGLTKYLLRVSQKGYIPESIRLRTYKVGVGNPLDIWRNTLIKQGVLELLPSSQRDLYSTSSHPKSTMDLWKDLYRLKILID